MSKMPGRPIGARQKASKMTREESSSDDRSFSEGEGHDPREQKLINKSEESDRFNHLREAKAAFLKEMRDPKLKSLTPAKKLESVIEKAEQLASFLLTKHKTFE